MAPEQKPSLENQRPTPNVDDLIAHTNHQAYTFHMAQTKHSSWAKLTSLPRTHKFLLIGGGVSVLFVALMVSLTLVAMPKANLTSLLIHSNTSPKINVDDSNQAAATHSDAYGDELIDYDDSADAETDAATPTDEDLSWWQRLLSLSGNRTETNTASNNTSSNPNTSSSSAAYVEAVEEKQEEQQSSVATTAAPDQTQTTTVSTPTPTPTLKSVTNFRDAAISTSGFMKTGVLYRSAKLKKANASDTATLASLLANGLVIDLRTKSSRSSEPDASISGVPNLNFPMDGAASASGYVKSFVNNTSNRKQLAAAIAKIADTQGAVLVHCAAGKDRTGWLVAMVMYAVGADDNQVMTEYLKSKDFGAKVDSAWLIAGLKEAKAKNGGSIANYLKSVDKGLGISDATIQKLTIKLRA